MSLERLVPYGASPRDVVEGTRNLRELVRLTGRTVERW
jgi:hypothetical protein